MDRLDKRIAELRDRLEHVTGRPCEVYSRIVGYYRSVRNWNKGKKEEYGERVLFKPEVSCASCAIERVA